MLSKTFLFLSLSVCLLMITSCDKDEECDFDISGTYTFQSASCQDQVNFPQTITVTASQTEFTFEGSVFEFNDCEFNTVRIESERRVTFDEGGFDFEGEFDGTSASLFCEGRYTKN